MNASSQKKMNLKKLTFLGSLLAACLYCLDISLSDLWLLDNRDLLFQPTSSSPFRRFYTCSPHKQDMRLIKAIFPYLPEPIPLHKYKDPESTILKDANEHDLLLAKWLSAEDCVSDGILNFPGTQIYSNTEPYEFKSLSETPVSQTGYVIPPSIESNGGSIIVNGIDIEPVASNQKFLKESGYFDYVPNSFNKYFILGAHADGSHNIRIYLGLMLLLTTPLEEHKNLIFDHDLKVHNTEEYFAVFMAHHCVNFRDYAVKQIAQLGTVHIGEEYQTKCMENVDDPIEGPSPNLQVSDIVTNVSDWLSNYNVYNRYKFAIVLENSYRDGYITEKIFMAWIGGAVPIWYGTHDIFDIFNEKALIYYDVEEPEAALEQIHYLDTNPDAYEAVLNEPILKNGQETIDEYFSFMDGKLRDRIRSTILGYEDGDDQMVEMVRK
mmetsp:Transcript_22643/g.34034  ORF Transcript_22643/g.34034 Transcript_22643/m.34034 type:complete len:436 (+) Transcript_22643:184-1491(+)